MDQHDRDNLQFLLNADEETLHDWYSKTTEDDHLYAAELLETYRMELALKNTFYAIDSSEISSTTDATEYLKKFTRDCDV